MYTLHITTADKETFFVEGYDAANESHTVEYIGGLATMVNDIQIQTPGSLIFMQPAAHRLDWT